LPQGDKSVDAGGGQAQMQRGAASERRAEAVSDAHIEVMRRVAGAVYDERRAEEGGTARQVSELHLKELGVAAPAGDGSARALPARPAAAAAAAPRRVFEQGFVWKRGTGFTKSLERRWMVASAEERRVAYYDDEQMRKVGGVVPLAGARLLLAGDPGFSEREDAHLFVLVATAAESDARGRVFALKFSDAIALQRWRSAMQAIIAM
jgi:hypothetical protein